MPFASNPIDGVKSYYEDDGGGGSPILVLVGLGDPLEDARRLPLVNVLAQEHRVILVDHRGHGRSDKPHDEGSYALQTRVADVVAVLDALHLPAAHFLGFSWGARLGFAMGESAPDRVLSLVLCGNQPYEWNPQWTFVRLLNEAFEEARDSGMQGFLDAIQHAFGELLEEPARGWLLSADPLALRAAWRSAMSEGAVSADLTAWRLPCFIYLSEEDEMHQNGKRAAGEIPTALFVSVAGHSHLSTPFEVDQILPAARSVLRAGDARSLPG